MLTQATYPYVTCREHGGPQRAWIVCDHLVDKDFPPSLFRHPTNQHVGVALCSECAELLGALKPPDLPESVNLMCEKHFIESLQGIRAVLDQILDAITTEPRRPEAMIQ